MQFSMEEKRRGFTLLEVLIATGIFTVAIVGFLSVFLTTTRVNVEQGAQNEVSQQAQFLLQQVQYYVERSSVIELAADNTTTTLKLRMSASAEDPTLIYASGTTVYLRQAGGTPVALTTSKVNVSGLIFTKRGNPPAHDAVSVVFSMAYSSTNPQQTYTKTINTTISRVFAATFDSNIVTSSTATYYIGAASGEWKSINNTVFFDTSGKVGIGQSVPGSVLSVAGNASFGTYSATAAPANGLIVSGNVGIGTSTPAVWPGTFQLQVASNTTPFEVLKTGQSGVATAITTAWLDTDAATAGGGSGIALRAKNSAGAISAYARIHGVIIDPNSAAAKGALSFWTENAGTITEQMRILDTGFVGIGTTTPSQFVEIAQNISGNLRLLVTNTSLTGNNNAGLRLVSGATATSSAIIWKQGSTMASYGGPDSLNIYQTGPYPIAFLTNDTVKMFITSNGTVGVGTTTPNASGTYASSTIELAATAVPGAAFKMSAPGTGDGNIIGAIAWTNTNSTNADPRVGTIQVSRKTDNQSGQMDLYVRNGASWVDAISIAPAGAITTVGALTVAGVISGVSTPVASTDAANKAYVDASGGVETRYVGKTTSTVGGMGFIVGANAGCNNAFAGSHMCSTDDLSKVASSSFTTRAWITPSNFWVGDSTWTTVTCGSPALNMSGDTYFVPPYNCTCINWNNGTASYKGMSFGGACGTNSPCLAACNSSLPVLCCK
jgi:prepilin-type N-terminal cleavage/methylation domain-containing protein